MELKREIEYCNHSVTCRADRHFVCDRVLWRAYIHAAMYNNLLDIACTTLIGLQRASKKLHDSTPESTEIFVIRAFFSFVFFSSVPILGLSGDSDV